AVRARPIKTGRFVGGGEPEGALPLLLLVELVGVGIGVRGLMPNQSHEPLGRLTFHLQDHLSLELAQPLVRQKERNENRRNAYRNKPFVSHMTGRVEGQALLRQLIVKLLDQRLEFGALQLQAKLGDLLLQQLVVAQIAPIAGFHALNLTGARPPSPDWWTGAVDGALLG